MPLLGKMIIIIKKLELKKLNFIHLHLDKTFFMSSMIDQVKVKKNHLFLLFHSQNLPMIHHINK